MFRGIRTARTVAPVAALGTALAVGGCASLTPPERPAWEGSDQVGEVDPASLIGTWEVTPLNPLPDQPEQQTVIEYRDDGTVLARVDPGEESRALLGEDARFEMTADWSLTDGIVRHENVEMEVVSDSALARLMSAMVNGVKRDLGGTADIQELDADRIVMLGEDGAAMEYLRR